MPIIASAIKKLRHDQKRSRVTANARRVLRETIRKTRSSPNPKTLRGAFQALDKAAKRNIIHKNKASRLKSRLSRLLTKK